jgi:hypothetical protein
MDRWRYRITVHTAADVLDLLSEPVDRMLLRRWPQSVHRGH